MKPLAAVLNALCALAALTVVIATAAFALIDPNDYRDRLVDAVQGATGRTLTIGGDLRLTRSLWPTVQASDVSLSNLPGGSRPDMAHAEKIEGQVSLLALLRHEVDITRLTLIGPNILFEQVGNAPNWVFTKPAASPAPASSGAPPFTLRIESAHVRDGMVTWKLPARTKVVGIRALDYRQIAANGPVEARSTLVYSDNQPFQFDIDAAPTGGVFDPWRTRLHFMAFDTDATAEGTMQVSGPYDLAVAVTTANLEKLNALLPEMQLPPVHGATLTAHLGNGLRPGDIPVIGPATLQFHSADLTNRIPGLVLAATRVSLPAPGGQAAIDGTGTYAAAGFLLTGGIGVPTHPDAKASVPVALSMTLAGKAAATMSMKGTLALDQLRFAGLEAATSLRTNELAGLRPVLGGSLPALADVQLAGHVSVPAGGRAVRLRGVTLQTAQGDLAGDGMVETGAKLSITGDWRSRSLDLDAALQAFGIDLGGGAARPASGPLIPATPLPWSTLRGPALNLSLAFASMQFQGQIWRDVQAAVTLKGGLLEAGPISVAMPGSRLEAAIKVDASSAAPPVSFSLAAPALPLALIARSVGLPGPMTGTAAISVQWRASGSTPRALASSLEGPFSIRALDGRLTNAALIDLTSAPLDALGIKVPAQGETRLDCLGLVGSFARGLATFRTIALQTTYLSLAGSGQVDLGRETVALKMEPMA
ncbi:MAG: AsmA family protein, partial [Acetobacteraceae bacterium]|nr:AsmA family protein [Acetobacteraceae bacterium]